jgi:formylglycine-generating enzyme required for sulfatase activity
VPKANADLAVYGCYYNMSGPGSCNIAPVGSVPAGNAKWGQSDLGGNMWEWVLDWYDLYSGPCVDCANTTSVYRRVIRGGSFANVLPTAGGGVNPASYLLASSRDAMPPEYRGDFIGPRCARSVK